VGCSHPTGEITDHLVQGNAGAEVRYAWRGVCLACRRSVLGMTTLPAGLTADRLRALLTDELMAYFSRVSAAQV
jgi:hypothetical protein